jgi:aconitate hydratase
MQLDLTTVEACLSGPKRPHDKVNLKDMQADWHRCLSNPIGFKGFGLPKEKLHTTVEIEMDGVKYTVCLSLSLSLCLSLCLPHVSLTVSLTVCVSHGSWRTARL